MANKKEKTNDLKKDKSPTSKKKIVAKKECDEKSNEEKKKIKKPINKLFIMLAIVIFIILVSVIFALINITNENILNNISVMGIDVGNLSKEDAKKAVNDVVNKKLEEEITLKKDDYETSITPNQINANFREFDTSHKLLKALFIEIMYFFCIFFYLFRFFSCVLLRGVV